MSEVLGLSYLIPVGTCTNNYQNGKLGAGYWYQRDPPDLQVLSWVVDNEEWCHFPLLISFQHYL